MSKTTNGKSTLKSTGKVEAVTMLVRRDSLTPAPWNPAIRVTTRNLKLLRDSMEQDGFWPWEPILVDRNGVIIDGNRRWAVATMLDIIDVPVTIVDEDAQVVWARANGTSMTITGPQTLQAVAAGLKVRPPKYASLLARLEDIVGTDGIKKLGGQGVSPHVLNKAMFVARYCVLDDDKAFIRATVFWLAKHPRMSLMISRAIREGVSSQVVVSAIRGDRPLEAQYA